MATGEKRWSVSETDVQSRPNFEPVPPGDYELKLLGSQAEVRCKNEPGSIPYVNVPFEILGSGGDSGKDKRVYTMFMCSLKPGKDGVVMPARGGGIADIGKTLGDQRDFEVKTKENAEGEEIDYLNPAQVVQMLKDNDGAVLNAHLKVQAANPDKGWSASNRIDCFIQVEEDASFEAEEAPPPPVKKNGVKTGIRR